MDKKEKQRYDYNYLQKYCQENHIELLEDYTNVKLFRDAKIKAKCLTDGCDGISNKCFKDIVRLGCFCKYHSKEKGIEKRKLTYIKHYGVENPLQLQEIKDKRKNTFVEKYGVKNPIDLLHTKEVRNKINNTFIEKYGVNNPFQLDEVKDKIKNTNLEKYGVEHVLQCQEIKDKIKNTNLEKYGVEHVLQCQEIKDKVKNTFVKKYGVDNPNKTQKVRDKIKKTNLEKYGVEYPSQNQEISEKQSKSAYKSKDFIFPSGRIERIQGYEHFMLNELLEKENISEDDIIVNRGEVPSVWYEDETGKQRRYFVDCYIKSQNRCIEAKSTWTANKKKDFIFLKQKALQDAGYICEIWIYNQKGEKVECYK